MSNVRAGLPAQESDLINPDAVIAAYYDIKPDPTDPNQKVVFGTSGHRGSSLDAAFNEAHIAAITAAIVEYRAAQNTTGPLFIGKDTHALSGPAWRTAIEVLTAAGVSVLAEKDDEYTPTPAVSRAIIAHNRKRGPVADGIVVTPSHNPPRDGGFKYNLPNGGPADTDATDWIADRANQLLEQNAPIPRRPYEQIAADVTRFDYCTPYCRALTHVIDIDAIAASGLRIGADPLGGASVGYWQWLAHHTTMDLTVVNPTVDPRWAFMTLDTDGKIRMDCSSPDAMARLIANKDRYDISTGNDADCDRHGIVTPDAGLMNPNHYLSAAIWYLFGNRPGWPADAAVGKTLVSSSMIDRVAGLVSRQLVEVPVGFKWFVPGLISGTLGFGGEESAGASFLQFDGHTWTTDKDGIILALLASEITARTGQTPSQHYDALEQHFGVSYYARIDSDATREQKARLGALCPSDVTATTLAGAPIEHVYTKAAGNDAPIGGLKVATATGWFAARPSGTEDKYKIYAESLISAENLAQIQDEAKQVVAAALDG
ncbi:MAG: phosphoglucomutase (alpha-D-glucose-1,6-bisphosphate-dependent) [Propionibacteriaceae bacterium]|nr:phosphoglucomutase (alpha-D-glucose-1,6-bisphosphate-dependent) [Propionibacteriaceae bacterium]